MMLCRRALLSPVEISSKNMAFLPPTSISPADNRPPCSETPAACWEVAMPHFKSWKASRMLPAAPGLFPA